MRCPFPGVDPYSAHPATWQDFCSLYLAELSMLLSGELPDEYTAQLEKHVRLVPAPPGVYDRPDRAVPALPLEEWEEVTERRLLVHRWPGQELITAIEMLSPWNKTAEGLTDFVRKRRATLADPVHWIEIDFLAGGHRTPLGGPAPDGHYRTVVARADRRPDVEVRTWTVRQPIPLLPVPLRAPHAEIMLDLAAAFATVYDRGRLDKGLRRLPAGPPPGPLSDEDAAWAAELAARR